MTEPPGVQPALGIESVEWFAAGGEQLMVRVTGRWLRRPAAPRGQTMLVVAADTQRHRFPAMPEPPSIGGTPPGAWRVSFSLPAWLAPYLSRRLSLQVGGVIVPLPGARSVNAEDAEGEQTVLDAGEYPEHGFATGIEPHPDELSDTEARVRELEREVAALRGGAEKPETGEPGGEIWDEAEAPGPTERSTPVEPISGALRQEIEIARGVPAAQPPPPAPESSEPRGLRGEREMLAARPRRPHPSQPLTPAGPVHPEEAGEPEELRRTLADVRSQLELRTESEALLISTVAALRRELQARTATEAHVRAQLATVQGSLDARTATQSALEATLGELREELTALRRADERELAAQADAEARAASLSAQLGDMRSQLAALGGERDAAQAEAAALRTEISRLRSELSAAQEVSLRDAAALARAEALLDEAHGLAADAEQRLGAEHRRAQEAVAAREQIEREFAEYRERSARVHTAIEELRQQLAAMRGTRAGVTPTEAEITPTPSTPPAPPPRIPIESEREPAEPTGAVEPERLTEALSRLRETVPEPEDTAPARQEPPPAPKEALPAPDEATVAPEEAAPAEPAATVQPEPAEPPAPVQPEAAKAKRSRKAWLNPALRSLTAQDAETAGQIIVELLPAQRAVDARKVSYDLVLGEGNCVLVTVGDQVEIERRPAPRELTDVDFRLTGDSASIARLVTSGRLRRALRRRLPKISGNRGAVAPLRALGRAQLDLRELHAAGVRLDAPLLLRLAASMVKPRWTYDDRFTIAYELGAGAEATTYLNVRGGGSPSVSSAPASPVTTTIVCSAESLLLLLAGDRPGDVELRGDEQPLVRLQSWIERAQSG